MTKTAQGTKHRYSSILTAIITGLFLLVMLPSCSKFESAKSTESGSRRAEMEMKFAQDMLAEAPKAKPDPLLARRKIIKTGDIAYEVTDLAADRARVDGLVKKHGGYISSEEEYSYESRIEQILIIRVPAGNFDPMVKEITEGAGTIVNKSIVSSDVTEEFIDTEARLSVKKDTETRYRELLKKAKTVKEILSIESHLSEVRAEIESLEGRMRYLKDQISLSTLTVTIFQQTSASIPFFSKAAQGLKSGWNAFVWFIIGLVNIWPFLILGGLGLYGFSKWRSKRQARKQDKGVQV